MKLLTILTASLLAFSTAGFAQNDQAMKFQEEQLTLAQEWDKTFPQSDKVDHCKITFHNRYGITLAADLYKPKNAAGKWTVRGSERAGIGTVCADIGRARFPDHCFRPLFYWRKRRAAPWCGIAGHQHGRLQCGGGLSVHP